MLIVVVTLFAITEANAQTVKEPCSRLTKDTSIRAKNDTVMIITFASYSETETGFIKMVFFTENHDSLTLVTPEIPFNIVEGKKYRLEVVSNSKAKRIRGKDLPMYGSYLKEL